MGSVLLPVILLQDSDHLSNDRRSNTENRPTSSWALSLQVARSQLPLNYKEVADRRTIAAHELESKS